MRLFTCTTLCALVSLGSLRTAAAGSPSPLPQGSSRDRAAEHRAARRVRNTGIALTSIAVLAGLPLLALGAYRLDGADGGTCCRDTMALNNGLLGAGVPLLAALIPGAILWSMGNKMGKQVNSATPALTVSNGADFGFLQTSPQSSAP